MQLSIDDFSTLCSCSVRYVLGRSTYIVGSVTKLIKENLSDINNMTICSMERDIRNAACYGMEIDHRDWIELLECLRTEMLSRNIEAWR